MRKIQKEISLEPMISRMPSVLPAYKDNVLYYFDNESLNNRKYEYTSNYGMIPVKLSYISASTENGVTYSFGCSENTISFERLSNWYHFFKEYYHLLNDYGHCNRTYSSATQYYYYESGERYASQMIYGTDKQTYIDLDEKFKLMGGIVDTANIQISGASDIGFYGWICQNIIPSYYISKEYTKYWKKTKLYYPDVIKWIAWFSKRLGYEEGDTSVYSAATKDEIEHWDCKSEKVSDCCDCEEFFNRGGKREYEKMLGWYDSLQGSIIEMNDIIRENLECFVPTMDDKIQLYNSLDDLGQYTIFSKEYELGTDYRTASYGDSGNTHGGTVAEVGGNTMILNNNANGFCFSPYYMHKEYDENAWSDYTDKYMKDELCPRCGYYGEIGNSCPNCGYSGDDIISNKDEFVADGYSYYAYDDNNVMYTSKLTNKSEAEIEIKSKFDNAYVYDVIDVNAVLINGTLYNIQHSEYGIYDKDNMYLSGKTFFVYRENDTLTPYTLINGKKIYAEWYPNPNPNFDNNPCYYFPFFKNENLIERVSSCNIIDSTFNILEYKPFGRKRSTKETDSIYYISYLGRIFQVTTGDTVLTIDNIEYPIIKGYAYDKDNNLMYCIDKKIGETTQQIVVDDYFLEEIPNSKIEDDKIIIGLSYEPKIYSAKELSGQTISRLTDLESTDMLIDDIGNKIDGRYNPNKVIIISDDEEVDPSIIIQYCVIESNGDITVYETQAEANAAAGTTSEVKKCYTRYNHQPPESKELDLLYEVGNVSNIRRFKLTVEEMSDVGENNTNYFVGNIIISMKFYYKDVNGNIAKGLVNNEEVTTEFDWENSSLETIQKSQTARATLEKNGMIFDGEDIYCDITYYIGATLSRKTNEDYKLAYTDDPTYNYGIEYQETVKFVKENREYYLKKQIKKQIPTKANSVSAHSVSYPIYVYKLKQELKEIEGDVYNTYFQSPLATFKTEINLIKDDLTSNFGDYKDMDKYNNIHVSPTFKEEYMLGISSLENVDSDIYIERGINAAFEKHLKLGEITSMETLEQYSNGYFKIMEN